MTIEHKARRRIQLCERDRCGNPAQFRITYDLDGADGWMEPVERSYCALHARLLKEYAKDDPAILDLRIDERPAGQGDDA